MSDFTQQMQRMMQQYMQPQAQMQFPQLPQTGGTGGLLDSYGAMKDKIQQNQAQQQPMTMGNPGALMGSMSNGAQPIMPASGAADPYSSSVLTPAGQAGQKRYDDSVKAGQQTPPDADATGAKSSFGDMMHNLGHPASSGGSGKGQGSVTGALSKLF